MLLTQNQWSLTPLILLIVFMESVSRTNMRLVDLILIKKGFLTLKCIYWAWLVVCFAHWLLFALVALTKQYEIGNSHKYFSIFFDSAFNNKLGTILFVSVFYIPIIFIIVSIIRRKIAVWEFCLITATWGLMFYVFSRASS